MSKIIESTTEPARFGEVEEAIVQILEASGGISNYSELQDLLPGVCIDKFFVSMYNLVKDEKIAEGGWEELKLFMQVENKLIDVKAGIARVVILC